jgi:hypothetical protein
MRFITAVALAAVMLWVPVDGVAQTQAEREMLQLYESRERQLLASMDPEADRQQMRAIAFRCLSMRLARTGRPGERREEAECAAAERELQDRLAARRNALQQELFALRQDKLELERRISLARASTNNPPQPPAQAVAKPSSPNEVRVAPRPTAAGLWDLDNLSRQGPQYLNPETLEPYSGPAYRRSADDSRKIVLRVNLRDGRFHGDFENFEPENDLASLGLYQTGTYRDGQLEGRFEYFYPSGVLRGRGTYENDLEEGLYESWFENGEPRSRTTSAAGELDGPYEEYHENGQLWRKGTLVAGKPCGEWIRDGETVTYDPCPPGLADGN